MTKWRPVGQQKVHGDRVEMETILLPLFINIDLNERVERQVRRKRIGGSDPWDEAVIVVIFTDNNRRGQVGPLNTVPVKARLNSKSRIGFDGQPAGQRNQIAAVELAETHITFA